MSLSIPVRTAAAGVLAALLAAGCGGGYGGGGGGTTPSYSVSVAVSGLSGNLVVLQGSDMLSFAADGTQTFGSMVPGGDIYAVSVSTQPATQYCTVGSNGTGLTVANVTVDVTCSASTGGIWTGMGQNGDSYVAMGDESGDFWLLDTTNDANGDVYVSGGNLTVSGTGANASVSGGDTGEALVGSYSDKSFFGSGTWSGTLDPRSTLTLTSAFTTTTPTVLPQTQLTLAYSSLYSQGSSATTIAGTYTEGTTAFSISSGGILFAQDSSKGCVLNGTVDPIVSNYNLYTIQYTVSNCTGGTNNALNGQTFNGFGAFEPANGNTAAQFIAVTADNYAQSGGTGYAYQALDLTQ